MTIAFFLFARPVEEGRGSGWAGGGMTAYFTCQNDKDSLPEMRNMIARKSSKKESKSSKCYRFPLSYFGECEPKSTSESSTAAYSAPPTSPPHLPFSFCSMLTDRQILKASTSTWRVSELAKQLDVTWLWLPFFEFKCYPNLLEIYITYARYSI